jgi:hypothetical protein
MNLLEDNIDTIKNNTENLIDVSNEFGLEINAEKTKNIVTYQHLPGYGSINTPRYVHATVRQMLIAGCYAAVSAPMDWRDSYHVTCFLCGVC